MEAAMAIVRPRWTYEQLLDLPDDGKRYEIIDGELIELPSPSPAHQFVLFELGGMLRDQIDRPGIGRVATAPFDFRLPDGGVVQPDLLVYLRPAQRGSRVPIRQVTPDLVIEILSPSTQDRDLGRKAEIYASLGIREYWPVDVRRRGIVVLGLRGDHYEPVPQPTPSVVRSSIVPNLEIDLAALFAVLDDPDFEIGETEDGV
jgi:Uma2 family endonuclease